VKRLFQDLKVDAKIIELDEVAEGPEIQGVATDATFSFTCACFAIRGARLPLNTLYLALI
jgi:hypothetical protein